MIASRKPAGTDGKIRVAFGSAFLLLAFSGITIYILVSKFKESERQISHTYEVQEALRAWNNSVGLAGRSRLGYATTGEEHFAREFDAALPDITKTLNRIKELTQDNAKQQEHWAQLQSLCEARTAIFKKSIALRRSAKNQMQDQINAELLPLVFESATIAQQMYDEEQRLLHIRLESSKHWFKQAGAVLILTFALAAILFILHYRLITAELQARKQAETNLQHQNRELISANKELDSFSYSVSHDLRAPLRIIDGYSQTLLEDYGNNMTPEAGKHLQEIRRATAKMGQMIEDLISLARVSRAQLVLHNVDLGELASEIVHDLQQAEPGRNVHFVAPKIIVQGDPGLLRIALENLLRNAWKFTAKTKNSSIELGIKSPYHEKTIFVRDNGAGFDMRQSNMLFRPFQRLHSSTDFPGTGIGLATVERVIRRHGGTVWAESSPGEGATFYFDLSSAPVEHQSGDPNI